MSCFVKSTVFLSYYNRLNTNLFCRVLMCVLWSSHTFTYLRTRSVGLRFRTVSIDTPEPFQRLRDTSCKCGLSPSIIGQREKGPKERGRHIVTAFSEWKNKVKEEDILPYYYYCGESHLIVPVIYLSVYILCIFFSDRI